MPDNGFALLQRGKVLDPDRAAQAKWGRGFELSRVSKKRLLGDSVSRNLRAIKRTTTSVVSRNALINAKRSGGVLRNKEGNPRVLVVRGYK